MSPQPPEDAVLQALLEVTKAEVETEFEISERYDSKARTVFGFAAGLFGVTQAFVLQSNFDDLSPHRETSLTRAVVISGVLFVVAVCGVIFATLQKGDRNFDHNRLFAMARARGTKLEDVVQQYIVLLGERRTANGARLNRLRFAQYLAGLSLIATAVEFTLATIYFI